MCLPLVVPWTSWNEMQILGCVCVCVLSSIKIGTPYHLAYFPLYLGAMLENEWMSGFLYLLEEVCDIPPSSCKSLKTTDKTTPKSQQLESLLSGRERGFELGYWRESRIWVKKISSLNSLLWSRITGIRETWVDLRRHVTGNEATR